MAIALERRDQNPPLLPENGSKDYVSLAQDADFEHLADVTGGKHGRSPKGEVVLWNNDLSLKKEVVNAHTGEIKIYLQSKRLREDITDYGIVIRQNEAAVIYPVNPIANVIAGIEIINGKFENIGGSESKFYDSYKAARNQSYQARLKAH